MKLLKTEKNEIILFDYNIEPHPVDLLYAYVLCFLKYIVINRICLHFISIGCGGFMLLITS